MRGRQRARGGAGLQMCRVGQNRIYTLYMTVYLMESLPTWQLWMHVYGAQNVQRCSPSAGLGVEGICTGAEEWITGARWCLDIGHKLFNDTYYPITIKR